MIELIVWILLGACLLAMMIIILRKFPTLAAIDSATMVSDLEQRKSNLIEERLKRKFRTGWSTVSQYFQPVGKRAQAAWSMTHQKLIELEHEYKIRSLPVFMNRRQRQKLDSEIQTLLNQA